MKISGMIPLKEMIQKASFKHGSISLKPYKNILIPSFMALK
jgi:hypothetical protein